MKELEDKLLLFCSIIDFGKGSKALKLSKELGAMGGTIFIGHGTVKVDWLNFLGIVETRKEVFFTIINDEMEDLFYSEMAKSFRLDKPHHGIAFSVPMKYCLRPAGTRYMSNGNKKGGDNVDYEAIFVIVDKNSMDEVLDAAQSAGSTGGTVIHGRGYGSRQRETLFNIQIEPEKEIILILSKAEKTDGIVTAISEKLGIKDPGNGIIFVMDVSRTLGLYNK